MRSLHEELTGGNMHNETHLSTSEEHTPVKFNPEQLRFLYTIFNPEVSPDLKGEHYERELVYKEGQQSVLKVIKRNLYNITAGVRP